jgi:hypothetical protein
MNMIRAIAVAACGFWLASCTSMMPSFDLGASRPATTNLTIASDPPGAEARTSLGGTCRTPCTMAVSVANEFTVSYTLDGYLPQTVSVRPTPREGSGSLDRRQDTFDFRENGGLYTTSAPPRLDPNPVFAELHPAAPSPKPPARRRQAAAQPPSGTALAPPPGTYTSAPGTAR